MEKKKPKLEITENELKKLNDVIDNVIKEKDNIRECSWDFIEDAVLFYIENSEIKEIKEPKIIVFKMRKMVEIALDFFKSIDEEFYEQIAKIVLGRYKNVKFNIFKRSEINDFNEMDDTPGFEKFKKFLDKPCINILDNKLKINIAILCGLEYNQDLSRKLKKDEGTIEDLYALVHELAHTLAFFIEDNEKGEKYEIMNPYADIFRESTSIGFERAFTSYLLKRGIIQNKFDIENHHNQREDNTLNNCIFTYARLAFAKIKEKNGEITLDDYIKVADLINNYHKDMINNLAKGLIEQDEEHYTLFSGVRYAFSGAISPVIEELINKGEIKRIKRYLNASKNEEFVKTLNELGITLDLEGMNNLKKAMIKELFEFEKEENEEER